jgi:tetratricopeptide (TPR) repeat protein
MKKLFVLITIIILLKPGLSQNNFTDLVKKTEKSVVTVRTFDAEGNPLKIGTAFFIDESGVLLSNFHVFSGSLSARIITSDNKAYDVKKILSSDMELDLIKFSISNPLNDHYSILNFAITPPLKGEDIFVIGSPGGFESSVSKGIVSGIRDVPDVGKLFQITAPISQGSSGSPVFNLQGQVFGIATLQYQEGQNMNFAIDINLVKKLLDKSEIITENLAANILPNDKDEATRMIDEIIDFDESLAALDEFIKKYPTDYWGYLKRALLYCVGFYNPQGIMFENSKQSRIGYIALSDRDFLKALQLSSNKSIVYYYRGISKFSYQEYSNIKYDGWDFKNALLDLNKCNDTEIGFINESTINYNKFEIIADIKLNLKDYTGAISAYNQAIINNPNRSKIYELYTQIARLYKSKLKDSKKALIYLNKAFSLIDEDRLSDDKDFSGWDMFVLRAHIKIESDDLSGAVTDLNRALSCNCLEATKENNYYLKAILLSKMDGDYYEVISSIEKAIEYAKDESSKVRYYKIRSEAYIKTNQYLLALVDLNTYFQLTPISEIKAADYSRRSHVKLSLKDNYGALSDINKAIELDYKNDDYYFSRGLILSELKDDIGAIVAYDKAIQINPKVALYYKWRGYAKYSSNETGACADWSKAGEMGDYSAYDLIKEFCH